MPHDHCPPSRRGHSWRDPDVAFMPGTPRRDLAAMRVCRDCGALGRINSQGVVVPTTIAEIKAS